MGISATPESFVYTTQKTNAGYAILRNNKPLNTYENNALVLPNAGLAEAVAEEWRLQSPAKPAPSRMPLMQLAATALDVTRKNRTAVIEQIMSYVTTELLCHRATGPESLVERQNKTWQPILDWCAVHFDALLETGEGIVPIPQSAQAKRALRLAVENYDTLALTGLRHAVDVSGSLVLGLAMGEQHLSADAVFQAAELESLHQMERNGEDEEALQRHEAIRNDLGVCERWFRLLKLKSA